MMKFLKAVLFITGCLFSILYLLSNGYIPQKEDYGFQNDQYHNDYNCNNSSQEQFNALSSSDIQQVKIFIIFLGHQRSGHSIVGSLLDAHPHIILAHEERLLLRLNEDLSSETPQYNNKSMIFNALWRNSFFSSTSGLRTKSEKALVKGYTLSIDGLYQGKFVSPIQVIGDKNGGQTTLMFIDDPSKWQQAFYKLKSLLNIPIKVIHVIRNPYDNIATKILYKYKGTKKTTKAKQSNTTYVVNVKKMKHYIDEYFNMFQAIEQMKSKYHLDYLEVHGKDLIKNPRTTILGMCSFLGVSCSDDYLQICSNKLFKTESKTRYNLRWSKELISDIQDSIINHDNLRRYYFFDS